MRERIGNTPAGWTMRRFMLLILLMAAVSVAVPASDWAGTVRQTVYGLVEGTAAADNTSLAWLGVPYAKPPLGELRWTPPQSPEPWQGVRETVQYGSRSMQPSGGGVIGGEDCLYLNIWRPATMETNLPVFFHLHGGSNQTGSGESFKGDRLAVLANCVVVSVNYRLGALGWFECDALKTGDPFNDSGNWGLLDAAKSLEWVRDNIAFFGGDPNNVSISGSSAGGRDCLALMISPIGKGLFHKALIFGGGLTVTDPKLAGKVAADVVAKAAVATGKAADEKAAADWYAKMDKQAQLAWLRSLPAEELIKPMAGSALRMANFPHLMRDGAVIPQSGFKTFATDAYDPIPVIVGSADFEFSLFAGADPLFSKAFGSRTLADDPAELALFLKMSDYGSRFYNAFNLETVLDHLFASPKQPTSYAYRIGWGLDPKAIPEPYNKILGGGHTSDNDFMTDQEIYGFNGTYPGIYYTEQNRPGRADLARHMMAYFRNFLHTGNPNGPGLATWVSWSKGNENVLHFSADADKADIKMMKQYTPREYAEKSLKDLSGKELEVFKQIVGGRFFYDTDY